MQSKKYDKWNEVKKKTSEIRKKNLYTDMLASSKDEDDPEGICKNSITQNSLNVKNDKGLGYAI